MSKKSQKYSRNDPNTNYIFSLYYICVIFPYIVQYVQFVQFTYQNPQNAIFDYSLNYNIVKKPIIY